MNNEALRNILEIVCDGYIDTVLDSIEENNVKDFPFTIACANFITELKKQNIIVEISEVFDDTTIDRITREISNFLAK